MVRLYLSPIRVDSGYRLTPNGYSGGTHVEQNIDFADGRDNGRFAPVGATSRTFNSSNAVQFVSAPLAGPFEMSGVFSGSLELTANKQDFDSEIALYEVTPSDDYVLISTYSTQANETAEQSSRPPLQRRIRQYRDYQSGRFPSRLIQNGSRLMVLITIFGPRFGETKSATSADVNGETTADPNEPLNIHWYGNSYIELHVRHR